MNEAQKGAIARELGTFQLMLAEVDACASCIDSTFVLFPQPNPGAPIPMPVFSKVAKAIKTQNQILYRLTKALESVLRSC